jgi:hypothetical protein
MNLKYKTDNPSLKWAKDLNRPHSKKETEMITEHMKRGAELAIREMQTSTMARYPFTSTRVAKI